MRMASIFRLRLVCASAAIIAGLASAAACAHAQERPWGSGIIEPKSDAGFQVMAVRGGFTARQGLKLDLPHFQNDVIALRALLAGELESYEGGAATAIIAAARKADVKIIGCHWQTGGHSGFARAEVKGPQDLKGATMAISAPHATPHISERLISRRKRGGRRRGSSRASATTPSATSRCSAGLRSPPSSRSSSCPSAETTASSPSRAVAT